MRIHGGCHCGAIAFEGDVEPGTILICHCTDCQTLSGTAYRAGIYAKAETFAQTGAKPTIYIKTGTSGAKRAHAFCPTCGTPIYSAAVENPDRYTLRVGTIAERWARPCGKAGASQLCLGWSRSRRCRRWSGSD